MNGPEVSSTRDFKEEGFHDYETELVETKSLSAGNKLFQPIEKDMGLPVNDQEMTEVLKGRLRKLFGQLEDAHNERPELISYDHNPNDRKPVEFGLCRVPLDALMASHLIRDELRHLGARDQGGNSSLDAIAELAKYYLRGEYDVTKERDTVGLSLESTTNQAAYFRLDGGRHRILARLIIGAGDVEADVMSRLGIIRQAPSAVEQVKGWQLHDQRAERRRNNTKKNPDVLVL